MALLKTVYQPASPAEAAALLARTDQKLALLGGGSQLIADLETRTRRDLDGVVDLSRTGLNRIEVVTQAGREFLQIGATVTLTEVGEHPLAGALAGGVLRLAAGGEGPINLRNAITVGGVVATAAADSEFYAALLALDATVVLLDGAGEQTVRLEDLTSINKLITGVLLPTAAARGSLQRVARTPADRPIVAAVAVSGGSGERIALCGVAARPVLLGVELNPPDDYKGSADYRRAMAGVLVARVRAALSPTL
jgi:carbon-monoxide dehydrogenase medium subunit/putative selenate reductase FAD-binding subunit